MRLSLEEDHHCKRKNTFVLVQFVYRFIYFNDDDCNDTQKMFEPNTQKYIFRRKEQNCLYEMKMYRGKKPKSIFYRHLISFSRFLSAELKTLQNKNSCETRLKSFARVVAFYN